MPTGHACDPRLASHCIAARAKFPVKHAWSSYSAMQTRIETTSLCVALFRIRMRLALALVELDRACEAAEFGWNILASWSIWSLRSQGKHERTALQTESHTRASGCGGCGHRDAAPLCPCSAAGNGEARSARRGRARRGRRDDGTDTRRRTFSAGCCSVLGRGGCRKSTGAMQSGAA